MGNKKKKAKLPSVLAIIEGQREARLLEALKEKYLDLKNVKFNQSPKYGGTPDRLLDSAINSLPGLKAKDKRVFVWIDEDKDITQEGRSKLFKVWKIDDKQKEDFLQCPLAQLQQRYNEPQQQNPILIVSQPICVESFILRILDKTPCQLSLDAEVRKKQIKELKNLLDGVIGKNDEYEFYRQNLTKETLEKNRKEIPELDLLISMFRKP